MNKSFLILFILFISFGCQNVKHNNDIENGIDIKILQIVDLLPLCPDVQNFVTIWFTSDTIGMPIIRVFNEVLIPIPPAPPAPYKDVLISETYDFKGYKKYNDWYIVFLQSTFNNKFNRFINVDSLKSDEKPFEKYNVYEWELDKYTHCIKMEKVYRIEENDSLALLNRDYNNVF